MSAHYEVEYDNRSRVPEHPEIFARWQREAAAYRASAHNPKLGIGYGPSSRRTMDLFPAKNDDKAPLAMFVHGGYWRSLEPSMFSQMAAGPNARGITVAVAGYDLCPHCSVADIIDQMRSACLSLWRKRRQRICVYGHSAGGHLAACMVAQDWKAFASDAPADLVPAAYAISGVFDRRFTGTCRPAAAWTPSLARWNRKSSYARAARSPSPGNNAWRSPVTRK
jgi:arylformamidase